MERSTVQSCLAAPALLENAILSVAPAYGSAKPAGVASGEAAAAVYNVNVKAPHLLLLLPKRQQSLRRRSADNTRNTDRDLAKRGCRDAAERNGADTNLAPEVKVAA